MTVSSETNRWSYDLDGVSSEYDYTTKIFASSDLVVEVYDNVADTTTTLTETTDYTVSGVGESDGGIVTLVTPSDYDSDDDLIIRKVLPFTQPTDLVENQPFLAETVEEVFDKAAWRDLQLQEQLNRVVLQNESYSSPLAMPVPSSDKIIGWNNAGTALENKNYSEDSSLLPAIGASNAYQTIRVKSDGSAFESVDDGFLNVKQFGATGDGVTDDTAAIQAAIDAALPNGIPLFFPVGVYNFTNLTLPITEGRISYMLIGSGCPDLLWTGNIDNEDIGGTILKCTADDGTHAITYAPTIESGCNGLLTIRDLEIQGCDDDTSTDSGDGIYIDDVGLPVNFENISVHHFRGGSGITLDYVENAGCRNVTVNRNKYGMTLTNAANANSFHQFVAQFNTDNAVRIYDSAGIGFFGGLIQANPKNGIYINGGGQVSFHTIWFEGNNSTSPNNFYAVEIEGTSGHNSGEISFYSCRFGGDDETVYLHGVSGGVVTRTKFFNCRSYATAGIIINDQYCIFTDLTGLAGGTVTDSGTYTKIGGVKRYYFETLANDATPSIKPSGGTWLETIWTTGGITTITDFDDGVTGQVITIVSAHSITITDGTNIFLSGSANFDMVATDTLTLVQKDDGKWYELSRSDNT